MTTTTTPPVQFQTIDGLTIRYADSGASHGPTILLTSPWPESLYAVSRVWAPLAEHARLFALDLPGFGASERRVAPVANAEFLDERLPNSRVAIIDAGHFVWEEAPEEYGSIIVDSISATTS
jgi:pimeloyl-ACP methyl ester carboxylesterase